MSEPKNLMPTEPPPAGLSRGFVYVAFGDRFLKEAAESAERVKTHHRLPCTLFTDREPGPQVAAAFDAVVREEFSRSYRDKLRMRRSAYDETIFLDTDTTVLGSLEPLFDLLRRFDLAFQFTEGGNHYTLPGIPESFPEPSAGILTWRSGPASEAFFDLWEEWYDRIEAEQGNPTNGAWDQRSLRAAAWHADVRLTALNPEWQLYLYKAGLIGPSVRMVHGRNCRPVLLAEINAHRGLRTYLPKVGVLRPYSEESVGGLLRTAVRFIALAARQSVRRVLHHTGLWRLPVGKRPA